MGWLNAAGAAGFGMTNLLGSPEQQRDRDYKMLLYGQNLAMEKEKLAETRRGHDLQYAPVDMTPEVNALLEREGSPPKPAGTYMIPRGHAAGFYGAFANMGKPQTVSIGDLYTDIENLTGAPVKRPEAMREEEAPPTIGENFATTRRVPDPEGTAALLKRKVPLSYADKLMGAVPTTLVALREARKAEALEKERIAKEGALTAFSQDVSGGMDRVQAFDKNNLATFGLKLSDLARPELQREPTLSESQMIARARMKPAAQRTPEEVAYLSLDDQRHEKTGPDRNPLDEEYKRMRNENLKTLRRIGNVVQDVKDGKTVPVKEARLHLDTLRKMYRDYRKDENDADLSDKSRKFASEQVADLEDSIGTLTKYLSKGPTVPGQQPPRPPLSTIVPGVKLGSKATSAAQKIMQEE